MVEPELNRHLTKRHSSKVRLVLYSALRLFVVLLSLQLSGIGHALADGHLFGDDTSAAQHDDCSSDERGRGCPPGCPTCHYANGRVSLPRLTSFVLMPPVPQVASFAPKDPEAPSSPELPSIFRPPKLG